MPKRQTTETLEPPSSPSCVQNIGAGRRRSEDIKIDAARNVTLHQGSETLQEALSTRGWFSASILHDLRNPLATICAGAELLMDLHYNSTEVKRLAAHLYHAAGRMRQLLADFPSITGDNVSTAEVCDIREVIASASEAVVAAMEQQSVQILLDAPDGIRLPLVRSHIERVFFNLIANSFEAMSGGGTVRIGARKAGASVLVELEDTGPGIPASIFERLFEPFVTSGKEHGIGLGLALARQTVRKHGGDIWAEPAAGARFVICLPLKHTGCVPGRALSS